MKNLIMILLLAIFCAPIVGVASEASDLFTEAKEVSSVDPVKARKLFQLSALKFQIMAENNPELKADAFYNAGNAYFFAEEQGRALYCWRQAEAVMPFNEKLKENIDYLKQLNSDSVAESPKNSIFRKIRALFPIRTRVMLAMAFYLTAAASFCVWQWRAKRTALVSYIAGGIAIFFAILIGVSELVGPKNGVVLSYQSQARKGDGFIYEPAFGSKVNEATEFRIRRIKGDWVLATFHDGAEGWLPINEVGLW